MRYRLPWLLLILSLAFNVFAVAGVFAPSLLGDDRNMPAQRLATVVERLGLTSEQRDQLIAVRERTIERRETMRAAGGRMSEVMRDTLALPAYDQDAFLARLQDRFSHRLVFFDGTVEDLHGFLADLSPDQKAAFLELIQERRFLRQLLGRPKAHKQRG